MEEPHAEELFGVSVLSHFAVADAHAAGEYMSRVSVAGPIRWMDGSQIPGDGPMLSVWFAAVGACRIDECGLDMELPPMQLRKKNANQNAARHMCRQYRAGIEATARQALPIKAREWSGWNSGTTDASAIDSCHVTIDSVGDSFGMHSPSFFGIAFGRRGGSPHGRMTEPTGPRPWRQRTEEYGMITYHCCTWGLVGSRIDGNLIGWQSTSVTALLEK